MNYAENSEFLKRVLPKNILATYIAEKRREYQRYLEADNKEEYERKMYFESI